jgi:hypothetical protein
MFLSSFLFPIVMAPAEPVLLACQPVQSSALPTGSSHPTHYSSSLGWPFPSIATLTFESMQLSSLTSSLVVIFSHLLPCWSTFE